MDTLPLILNIDTSTDWASVCLARDGIALQVAENKDQKDHSSWLHEALQALMKKEKLDFPDLDAIAVTIGPGSYTGLRIGLSAAKGFCYALGKPLITVGTLEMMALAAKEEPVDLLCPMIDARRLEVFTALFDRKLNPVLPPQAMIINEFSFNDYLPAGKILFYGNGAEKARPLIRHENAFFKQVHYNASALAILSGEKMEKKIFENLAYSEPLYLKDFQATGKHS